MEKRKIFGYVSIAVGILFLLNSQMTGAVISTSIDNSLGFLAGMALLIGGIGLILAKGRNVVRKTEGGIEIIITDGFIQSLRNVDLKRVNRALEKIGTGKGHEETLKRDKELYSIRGSGC
jgi:hypothetical protein